MSWIVELLINNMPFNSFSKKTRYPENKEIFVQEHSLSTLAEDVQTSTLLTGREHL
jgi:hypothetical protein